MSRVGRPGSLGASLEVYDIAQVDDQNKPGQAEVQMSHRFLVSLGVLAVAAAVVSLALVPVAGQAPTTATKRPASAKTWTAPRTPDGQPDL